MQPTILAVPPKARRFVVEEVTPALLIPPTPLARLSDAERVLDVIDDIGGAGFVSTDGETFDVQPVEGWVRPDELWASVLLVEERRDLVRQALDEMRRFRSATGERGECLIELQRQKDGHYTFDFSKAPE